MSDCANLRGVAPGASTGGGRGFLPELGLLTVEIPTWPSAPALPATAATSQTNKAEAEVRHLLRPCVLERFQTSSAPRSPGAHTTQGLARPTSQSVEGHREAAKSLDLSGFQNLLQWIKAKRRDVRTKYPKCLLLLFRPCLHITVDPGEDIVQRFRLRSPPHTHISGSYR